MALTRDFRVKDSLNVGLSGLFKAGNSSYNGNTVAIDTYGRILSGGQDLADIFADANLQDLTGGTGINSFAYDGLAPVTISLSGANTLTNDSLIKWSTASGLANSTLTDASLVGLRTSVLSNSANWSNAYSSVNLLSSKWDSSYATVNSLSSKWDTSYATTNSLSGKWDSSYATTNSLSSKWDSSYATTNSLSGKWDSSYATVNTLSSNWGNAYSSTNSLSGKWDSSYATVNTLSSNWNTAYGQGTSVYAAYNAASGTILNNVTVPATQGQFSTVELDGGGVTRTLHNLSTTGTPTFAGLTVTGGVSAVSLSGNGAGLTNVTATPIFPSTAVTDLASTNFIFVNTDASGAISGNNRITYSNLLTDLAGTGLAVESSDSLGFKNAAGLTNAFIPSWDSGNGQLINSSIRQNGTQTVIGSGLSAMGLTTIDGPFTARGNITLGDETTDVITINGPVYLPNLTSPSVALFIGGDVNLYRSAADTLATDDSLTVSGNFITNGNITLGGDAADTLTINAGPVNIPNATAATDAIVIGGDVNLYRSTANVLRTDTNLSVGGNTTITGNLSVLGDFTRIDTLVAVTSALSVINSGTGPAIYIEQTGVNPIAQFVDRDGGAVTISDTGSVGIGTALSAIPSEKLTVTGNISASGTLKLGTLAAGTSDSVVIESGGVLQDRTINPSVWNTTAQFISGSSTRTANTIPKFSSSTGITNSLITDDGTNIILSGNLFVQGSNKIRQYGAGNYYSTEVFTQSLSSGTTNVLTFNKTGLNTVKYVVSLATAGSLRTAFEIMAVYNGTDGFGTVYGIVDAQATSLLNTVDIVAGTSTLDLSITVSSACSVVIQGDAQY